jgi:oligopeptide transport system permease protein
VRALAALALWRFLSAAFTLFVVASLAFVLIRLLPGGPFDAERAVPAEVARALDARYHLDEPVVRQYGRWLTDLVLHDMGPSFRYPGRTVGEIVRLGLPVSASLGALALGLAVAVGVPLGVLGAARRGTALDAAATAVSAIGVAVPRFVLGPILVLVFSLHLYLLPAARWDSWRHMVLPVICASAPTAAYLARLSRAGMIEVLGSDFVRVAHAKGLPERAVLFRHALRGGLLPVVSFLGPGASGLLVGSLVVEKIFDVPGMGRYFVEAAQNRDYNLVLGVTLVYGALVMTLNAVADLVHAALDPRVRAAAAWGGAGLVPADPRSTMGAEPAPPPSPRTSTEAP